MWKSNSQGVKEETFIQTGRRDRDGQPGVERECAARQQLVAGEVGSFTSACRKRGGATGEQDRPHNPGFQCGEIKPQNL